MDCREFRAHLDAYVDGELAVDTMLAGRTHAEECPSCASEVESGRRFRQILSDQPRESAPAALRTRITVLCHRDERWRLIRPWVLAPALAAALVAVALLAGVGLDGGSRSGLVASLVDTHIVYAQIERPAEFMAADQRAVEAWFRDRAGLRVTVPDYSPAGIRLVGGRIAQAEAREVAYLLYEKGRVLMSVFMASGGRGGAALGGRPATYRGHEYRVLERKGYRTVSWTEGATVLSLVSMLDYDPLLECADRLRAERAGRTRL
jgi:mycothiol system anti-sigma-R factor